MDKILAYQILDNSLSRWIIFIAFVLLAYFFKKYISQLLSAIVYKLFRRLTSENEAKKFHYLMHKPFEWFVVYTSVYFAFKALHFPATLQEFAKEELDLNFFLHAIYRAIGYCINTWIIWRIIDFLAFIFYQKFSENNRRVDRQIVPFFKDSIKVLVAVITVIISLRYIFNLNNTSILSTLGFTAVAIGLALKDTIENLFGSFTLLLDKPFTVGDNIRFNNIEGTVEKVGFRSTKIRTLDKSLISVPNKQLVEGLPDNISGRTSRRHEMIFYLSVNSKSEAVKKLLLEIDRMINSHALIHAEKAPYLKSISLDGIEIWVAFSVETGDSKIFNATKEEIHLAILRFIEEGHLQLNERH